MTAHLEHKFRWMQFNLKALHINRMHILLHRNLRNDINEANRPTMSSLYTAI